MEKEDNNKQLVKTWKVKRKYIYLIFGIFIIIMLYGLLKPITPYTPLTLDEDHVLGVNNASLTIIEFSDFECPFCADFTNTIMKDIKKEYIETGRIKFVFKHFPIQFHPNAQMAAEAAECASDQGKFWEMHDIMFKNHENLNNEDLIKYAKEIGLNNELFEICLKSGVMKKRVELDMQEARLRGIDATPFFVIGSESFSGSRSFEEFKAKIDKNLRKN
jgi:protein-disulfide isomerase